MRTAAQQTLARGRPRCTDAHARILRATRELLHSKTWNVLTVESVAARANVGKQTIYKWWGGLPALLLEASLENLEIVAPALDSGDTLHDVADFLKRASRMLWETSMGRSLAMMIAEAQHDPAFGQMFREKFQKPRRAALITLFRQGMRRGSLRADLDPEVLVDVIFGAVWYRLLSGRAAIDDDYIEQVIGLILPGIGVGRRAGHSQRKA